MIFEQDCKFKGIEVVLIAVSRTVNSRTGNCEIGKMSNAYLTETKAKQ